MSEFIQISKIGELKDGTMKTVNAAGREILLARVGDKYYAADSRCPHMKGDLSRGELKGTVLTCPVHGSQFDLSNGQVIRWLRGGLMSKVSKAFKLFKNLAIYNVKVEGSSILVEI